MSARKSKSGDSGEPTPASFRFPKAHHRAALESDAERDERRRRLEYLGQLASGLAHEIKNPLSTIKLNLQLMAEDWRDATAPREVKTRRKIGILMDEIRRLEKILEDFLMFARGSELDPEPTDVGQLVQEVADFVEPELRKAKISLWSDTRSRGPMPSLLLDRKKIKQALLNLIINARQAMDHKGGELFLNAWRDGDEVVIEVTDTGPGIPPEIQGRIFEAYFSTKPGGTGLGLAIVRRVVEEHGGRLTMHSEPGIGTQFLLYFPLRQSKQSKAGTEA